MAACNSCCQWLSARYTRSSASLFRDDTTFHLVRALFASLCQEHGTGYLFTPANPKHNLLLDVILRRTTFSRPILPSATATNVPWFSSETLALYKSLTHSLTHLSVFAVLIHCHTLFTHCSSVQTSVHWRFWNHRYIFYSASSRFLLLGCCGYVQTSCVSCRVWLHISRNRTDSFDRQPRYYSCSH